MLTRSLAPWSWSTAPRPAGDSQDTGDPPPTSTTRNSEANPTARDPVRSSSCSLTNRASAAGARLAGAPCARFFYATGQAHKRNSSLLGRARQLQALVRWPPHEGRRSLSRRNLSLLEDPTAGPYQTRQLTKPLNGIRIGSLSQSPTPPARY